ncbi:GDSL-type esterase/lipase family protein [Kineococcus rhizosphaerae]|uniref:Lysophospholipase L1-like esterase n=1 Tax=Kineococcus rhizosphaerae TaxID=559628 RepID=A0A2T0QX53_9ACTN|nr:GDSL-type esterase/lipase family protein [Kineococcus rhizosphaerae]PRY10464.1 lysophospholipase L1-like esterase [Kineococcus rhizosphaerae]
MDVRVCFVGDSFVAGVGDPGHLGWTGRVAVRTPFPLTRYVLGVRRETSAQVARRWRAECGPRLPAGSRNAVVLSFGVNDTTLEDGRPRVRPQESVATLDGVLREVPWPVLVVGPPAVDDEAQNERSAVLDAGFARVCAAAGVAYVPVLEHLRADAVWRREVRDGDGAHPAAAGYERLARLVEPAWRGFVHRLADG